MTSDRVTDENAPVTVLDPGDPLLTTPERITEATWKGWVQERGLYFLGEQDSRYRDLVAHDDPFPYNQGEKTRRAGRRPSTARAAGSTSASACGASCRPACRGAYQLLANLLSYKG